MSLQQQLEDAQEQLAQTRHALASVRKWHDEVMRAVHDHPDGVPMLKRAAGASI
ncbi:hypothetical protein ACFXKF_32905 [Streptomyces scopuliridis]|uniref:hypothetical protein n=1 Tax=Streptomyces scopuliridis TaxID=452529 RepID=UPI0036C7328F